VAIHFTQEQLAALNLQPEQLVEIDGDGNPVAPPPEPPPELPAPPPPAAAPPVSLPESIPIRVEKPKRKLNRLARYWITTLQLFVASCLGALFVATPGILLLVLVVLSLAIAYKMVRVHPE
jgi:hypothetical protein